MFLWDQRDALCRINVDDLYYNPAVYDTADFVIALAAPELCKKALGAKLGDHGEVPPSERQSCALHSHAQSQTRSEVGTSGAGRTGPCTGPDPKVSRVLFKIEI